MRATSWQEPLGVPFVRLVRRVDVPGDPFERRTLALVDGLSSMGGARASVGLHADFGPRETEQFFTVAGAREWADRKLRERGVELPEDPSA
jgi:hypothetical protein